MNNNQNWFNTMLPFAESIKHLLHGLDSQQIVSPTVEIRLWLDNYFMLFIRSPSLTKGVGVAKQITLFFDVLNIIWWLWHRFYQKCII